VKLLVLVKKINKYETLLFSLVFITFVPFREIISWGSDYAGYILQAKAMINFDSNEFISNQTFLAGLSDNPKYPIYTPLGMPLIIGVTSIFHNFDPFYVRYLVPISVFLIAVLIFRKCREHSLFLAILFLLNPTITNQYKDAVFTESIGILFFLYGSTVKNTKIKTLLYIFSVLIRPTFILLVMCDIFFSYRKNLSSKYIVLFLCLIIVNFLTKLFFNMNFYGLYRQSDSETDGLSIVNILIENVQKYLTQERIVLYLEELGFLISGFSHPLNLFLGIIVIAFLLIIKDKYSIMILIFTSFHIIWETPSFNRYFIPVIPLLYFAFDNGFGNLNKLKKINKKLVLFLLITTSLLYSFLFYNLESKKELQAGPHQTESQELINYINNLDSYELFSFHSPRTLRLFTNKDAYWLDGELYEGTVIICYKKDVDCIVPKNYEQSFSNSLYKVHMPN